MKLHEKIQIAKVAMFLVLGGMLWGCATTSSPHKVRPVEMARQLTFQGFQISRPPSEQWFFYPRDPSAYRALFRQDFQTATYDAFVEATLAGIPSQPQSFEEFETIVQGEVARILDRSRFEVLAVTTHRTLRQGQWCVTYSAQVLDRRPANSEDPLIMQNDGFYVLHPSQTKTAVHGFYSQRGQKDELKAKPDDEAQFLLDSVRLVDRQGNLIS